MSLSLVVDLRLGLLIPPGVCNIRKLVLSYELFLNMAVRGDSNPDTLPYTHFPCVLLQPLGHLHQIVVPVLLERALI